MGENEQGGMLRVVAVLGLIAIIAAVVIFAVTGLKGNMTKNSDTAVYNVDKAGKPYQFNSNNGYVSFDSYQSGKWNGTFGTWYRLPVMGNVPPDNWREVHVTLRTNQTSAVSYDINNYDYDVPGGLKPNPVTGSINDCDVLSERSIQIYDGSKVISGNTLQANHDYTIVAKWHNGTSRTLYEGRNVSDRSSIVVGTPDGSAGSFTVTAVEGATYKMP